MVRREHHEERHETQTRKRRIPFSGKVFVDAKDGLVPVAEEIQNLSTGGMFIKSLSPLPPGRVVYLTLVLQSYKLRTSARVLWTRPVEKSESKPAGMAVEFLDLTEAHKKLLYLEVDHHLKHGGALLVGTPHAPATEGERPAAKAENASRLTQTQIWLIVGLGVALAIVALVIVVSVV